MNRKSLRCGLGLVLLLLCLQVVNPQTIQRRYGKSPSPKIVNSKPGVFITFERFGKRTPVRDGEDKNGIWLRLHNNMRYSIGFCTFGVPDDDNTFQIGPYYDVLLNPRSITDDQPLPKVPVGYPVLGTCQDFKLESGKSMVFSVPNEHLAEDLSIKIGFSYGWEETSENNPTHFVHFNSFNLPKRASK